MFREAKSPSVQDFLLKLLRDASQPLQNLRTYEGIEPHRLEAVERRLKLDVIAEIRASMAATPPIAHNFHRIPSVTEDAYDYGKEAAGHV